MNGLGLTILKTFSRGMLGQCSLCDLGRSREYTPALCIDFGRSVSGSWLKPIVRKPYDISGRLSSMMLPWLMSSVIAAATALLFFHFFDTIRESKCVTAGKQVSYG